MKTSSTLSVLLVTSLLASAAEWNKEDRKIEAEQILIWDNNLDTALKNNATELPNKLWLGMRCMGYRRSIEGHSPVVDVIYNKIQASLLSHPGHAQFFGDRIHAAYEPLKGPNRANFIHSAQTEMMYSFETLKNLPSPETVQVLGEMLSETWRMPFTGDYTPPALAYPAMTTLGDLGIRNAPWKPIIIAPEAEGAIPVWQVWWEEVKSGKRSFSFAGQTSEYRFKPDGTWETIPISLPPEEVVPKAPVSVTPESVVAPPKSQDRTWLWLTSLSLFLVAVVGWLVRKKSRAGI